MAAMTPTCVGRGLHLTAHSLLLPLFLLLLNPILERCRDWYCHS
jgi:hypothetical protein